MKHKGDLEFPNHKVNVAEQRIETVGQSLFYVAEGNSRGIESMALPNENFSSMQPSQRVMKRQ